MATKQKRRPSKAQPRHDDPTQPRNHIVGIMDPNSYSFRVALEELFAHLDLEVPWGGRTHKLLTRRIMCRPYNTLECKTTCSAILNRGAHWNPHHNSFFSIVAEDTYLLNDMVSFKAVDKNYGYGQMARMGLRIPTTWAIPQEDYSEWHGKDTIHLDLIFSEHELFDLATIGEAVGYPAYLKPQDGGGWVGVERVNDAQELFAAYKKSGKRPVNLQKAVDYKEFVRTVGIGPQMYPMHYNAAAEFPHFRYMRTLDQAVDFDFLTPEQHLEASRLCKVINAFYNWDHNSCEALLDHDGTMWAIDFANAYPDSMLTSLHFYFPDIVKGMVRWLTFCAVSDRRKPVNYSEMWPRYHEVHEKATKDGWTYEQLLAGYEKLADEHFDTEEFGEFCTKALAGFDAKALEYFESEDFDAVIVNKCRRFFKVEHEVPAMIEHYRGIHRFWCYCERERLGLL